MKKEFRWHPPSGLMSYTSAWLVAQQVVFQLPTVPYTQQHVITVRLESSMFYYRLFINTTTYLCVCSKSFTSSLVVVCFFLDNCPIIDIWFSWDLFDSLHCIYSKLCQACEHLGIKNCKDLFLLLNIRFLFLEENIMILKIDVCSYMRN